WILRTHSSSFAMSVSSSHGFTSNRIEDLAMMAGSGEKGESSSEPNRSMSSSSSSLAVVEPEVGFFTPGRLRQEAGF
uniref:Uncharacterized protein n=1 Tax=Amphilophus citrinellus TaxID=61819 RepID=A0A3Q0T1S9_AMPCI